MKVFNCSAYGGNDAHWYINESEANGTQYSTRTEGGYLKSQLQITTEMNVTVQCCILFQAETEDPVKCSPLATLTVQATLTNQGT